MRHVRKHRGELDLDELTGESELRDTQKRACSAESLRDGRRCEVMPSRAKDIDVGAHHIDDRANDIFWVGIHRTHGIEDVCYHLVELGFQVARTD